MECPPPALKPVTFWDFISFRIPEQWSCIREPDGHWGCYEEDKDTGTVWVDFDLFRLPDEEDVAAAVARSAAMIRADSSVGAIPPMRKEFEFSPLHKVVHRVFGAEENGELLYFSWWSHILGRHPYLLSVQFNFVLTASTLADRGVCELAEIIDRELMNATIKPEIIIRYPT